MNTQIQSVSPARPRTVTRALVVAAAALAAIVVWVLADPLMGINVTVPETPGSRVFTDLQFLPVVATAVIASLAGWAFLAVLERIGRRPREIWTVTAVAVFILTLPYAPGFTVAERVVLALVHLALAVVLIVGMRRTMTTDTAGRGVTGGG